jgi:hypothetical protein
MATFVPTAGQAAAYCTVREAARAPGVHPSKVARAVRLGVLPSVRRRNRLVVPVSVLAGLLGERGDEVRWSGDKP